MPTPKRRALSLASLHAVRDRIVQRIAECSARWNIEVGDGNRFCDETYTEGSGCWLTATYREPAVVPSNQDVLIRITLNVSNAESYFRDTELFLKARVEGETEFKVIDRDKSATWGGWRGWVRHGIDCASVWLGDNRPDCHVYPNVADLIDGEYGRVQSALKAASTAKQVPGYGFSRQPEWFTQASADLKAGRAVTLTPSGFGTGYRFTTRRASRFDQRADSRLEHALNVAPIYVQTLDCD